eukprot:550797_1
MLQLSWRQFIRASMAYCGIYMHRPPIEFSIIEGRGRGLKSSSRTTVGTECFNIKTTTVGLPLSFQKRRLSYFVTPLEMLNGNGEDGGGFSGYGGHRRKLEFVWLENALSTMDEARVRVQQQNTNYQDQSQLPIIAVATSNQLGYNFVFRIGTIGRSAPT